MGTLIGAVAGYALDRHLAVKPGNSVFLSFDFHHDRALKEFLLGQSRLPASPFQIVDCSLHEAAPEPEWELYAREKIQQSDMVLVLLGQHTHQASGVLREVEIAHELDKPIAQLIAHADRDCPPLKQAGRLYRWSWSNLNRLFD